MPISFITEECDAIHTVVHIPSSCTEIHWGVEHEDLARAQYAELSQQEHRLFECHPADLMVNPDHPHLGASQDGMVSCACCADGLLEIKCPYVQTPRSAPTSSNWPQLLSSLSWRNNSTTEYTWLLLPNSRADGNLPEGLLWLHVLDTERHACESHACEKENHAPVTMNSPSVYCLYSEEEHARAYDCMW